MDAGLLYPFIVPQQYRDIIYFRCCSWFQHFYRPYSSNIDSLWIYVIISICCTTTTTTTTTTMFFRKSPQLLMSVISNSYRTILFVIAFQADLCRSSFLLKNPFCSNSLFHRLQLSCCIDLSIPCAFRVT